MLANQRSALNFILCYNNLFVNIIHNINPNICIPYLKLNLIDYNHYNGFIYYTPIIYKSNPKKLTLEEKKQINKFYGMIFTYDFYTFYDEDTSKLKKNYIHIDNLFIDKYHGHENESQANDSLYLIVSSFELSHSSISSIFWIPVS